jgi:hypothetical protein
MKRLPAILSSLLTLAALYSCLTFVPAGNRQEDFITFTLESIPSGAAIYQVNNDGTLVQLIGITPFVWRIRLALQRNKDGTSEKQAFTPTNAPLSRFWANASGITWIDRKTFDASMGTSYWQEIVLNVAIVKASYFQAMISNKVIASIGKKDEQLFPYPPPDTAMVVHLQPITKPGDTQ